MRLPTDVKKKGGGIALRAPVSLSQKARYFLCKLCSLWHIPGLADCFLLRDPNSPDEWANKTSSYPPDRGRVWMGIETQRLISIGCFWKGLCIGLKHDLGWSPQLDGRGKNPLQPKHSLDTFPGLQESRPEPLRPLTSPRAFCIIELLL